MIFQGANLLPWKTALQNVAFAYELTHPGSSGARIRAQEWLSRVGISEDAWQSYPHELSGGMAMRVAIARALIVEPGLLLSDEPFGALDESLRERLQSDLREFHTATSMTHVLVTHSVSEAVWMSDEVWILGGAPATFLRKSEVALERIRKPELRWSSEFHGEVRRIRELTQEAALEKSG
jgi:NitT/TauT family transport system ATP-binding protein